MAVREVEKKPNLLLHFPDRKYRWLELFDEEGVYGNCAFREHGSDLELHLSFSRWGPGVRRSVGRDLEWLKSEARRLGMKRLMGIRVDSEGHFDPGLFRFAELYGFEEKCVIQTTILRL